MALVYIILFLFLFGVSSISAECEMTCSPRSAFVDEVAKLDGLQIHDVKLSIIYDPSRMLVNQSMSVAFLNATNITFTGYIESNEIGAGILNYLNYNTRPLVIQSVTESVDGKKINHCKLTRLGNDNLGLSLTEKVEAAVLKLSEHCLISQVCEQFGSINSRDSNRQLDTNDVYFSYDTDTIKNTDTCIEEVFDNFYNPQGSINALADFGLASAIHKFTEASNGDLTIPDIIQEFSTGSSFWTIKGAFVASDIAMENLPDIQRTKDFVIRHEGARIMISTTYHLDRTRLRFGRYTVRFAKIKTGGKLAVELNRITVSVAIAIDFNNTPCGTKLAYFKVDEMGGVKVQLTGFGIFNTQVSNIVANIIREKAMNNIQAVISEKLAHLDCEQFRPRSII